MHSAIAKGKFESTPFILLYEDDVCPFSVLSLPASVDFLKCKLSLLAKMIIERSEVLNVLCYCSFQTIL